MQNADTDEIQDAEGGCPRCAELELRVSTLEADLVVLRRELAAYRVSLTAAFLQNSLCDVCTKLHLTEIKVALVR
jgi:hypothetical protein